MIKTYILLICCVLILSFNIVFNKTGYSEDVDIQKIIKTSISEVFIEQDLIEGNDLGTFGNIVNKVFSIPSGIDFKDINTKQYTKNSLSYEVYSVLEGAGGLTIIKNSAGKIVRVIYSNMVLFPFEHRAIDLNFDDPIYPNKTVVVIKINTFAGKINKKVFVLFEKGNTEPINIMNLGAKIWNKKDIGIESNMFNKIYDQAIASNFLNIDRDESNNFERNLIDIVPSAEDLKEEYSLLMLGLPITGIPIHISAGDYYWINDHDSFLVLRNMGNTRLKRLLRYRRISSYEIRIDDVKFQDNGTIFSSAIFNTFEKTMKVGEDRLFGLMKAEYNK